MRLVGHCRVGVVTEWVEDANAMMSRQRLGEWWVGVCGAEVAGMGFGSMDETRGGVGEGNGEIEGRAPAYWKQNALTWLA